MNRILHVDATSQLLQPLARASWQNLPSDEMTLNAGTRLGAYEIQALLGAGGMGEVYRARDTKLHRDVAIKVLPELFASDPERLSRFEREAHLLAALNHPHIAHVYGLEGLERQDGQDRTLPFIVMEFVDGPTLADRLAHGPTRLDEALPIARQIAEALEAAHEQGIIHRDLKPANIKVKDDGTVKVLDFGLAKLAVPEIAQASRPADGGAGSPRGLRYENLSVSPTMISPAQMTHVGVILGTAAYMAPEQAKGRPVDKRADIWAFGCVLFEMLTGKPIFTGETVTETLASVMRDAPRYEALPVETPRHIRRLLGRCLERDPRQRLRDIGEARVALDAAEARADVAVPASTRSLRPLLASAAAVIVAAVIAGAVVWRLKPAAPAPLRKFDLALNTGIATLSPDGSRLAYAVADRLFLRDLTAAEPRELGALPQEIDHVGWSPDGNTIFTSARDGKIRTIPARGGAQLVVCEIPESHETIGVTWIGTDLVFAAWRGSLYRVDARGGTPKLWLAIETKKDVDFHGLASLPDGRVVFSAHEQNGEFTIESFDGVKRTQLLPSVGRPSTDVFGTVGQFLYSPTGHLLFTRFDANSGLWAVPFRGGTVDPTQAFLVAPNVTAASVANDGTLLIRFGSDASVSYDLITVNRSGQPGRTLVAAAAGVSSPAVSPDGRHVAAVVNTGGQRQLWIQETAGTSGARLTSADDEYAHPAWFPSGDRVLYTGHAPVYNAPQIYGIASDGSGSPQKLGIAHRAEPTVEGKEILYMVDERGDFHVRRGRVDGRQDELERVFRSDPEPSVRSFALSPDGSVLAYVDYKAGRADLMVTRYPSAEGRWQVFGNGGRGLWGNDEALRWARGTRELFFTISRGDAEGARVMVADVRADRASVAIGQPTALFDIDADALAAGFDVSPDGKTFYFRRRATTSSKGAPRRFVLIQNWTAEFVR